MIFREALLSDIPGIQRVRNSVKENTLSDPALVPDQDVKTFLFERGKGWVCEIDQDVVGFAIADLVDNNIWALFIDPEYEAKGIGKKLHGLMLNWYFSQTDKTVWLGTAFNTRAETFYRLQGWIEVGLHGTKETKFEMTKAQWETVSVF
ncbi:GNAT family N-acetyltransferase [Ferruginibacter sp. HRS2-29]|uniref:GNAT family N-acetyltransferase n=1 Tax=Ferruginibacter sp. HRS2-29 TaxID=2487334 RepID=UPI0020CC0EE2|nr:GNAT family N-acetyltransferase [Ferruginibacter sp. HRS2-29]MCP9751434.1 GNAT family N-acetyltransferase [Ferruginibacter sp. HRS2-29]